MLLRLCCIRSAPWPLACLLGVSLAIAAGGVLNLTTGFPPSLLIAFIAFGDLLLLWSRWREIVSLPRRIQNRSLELSKDRRTIAIGLLLFVLVSIPVLRNVRTDPDLFGYDDWSAYVSLPAETFQLGTLPQDPFNERRVTSSLGSPYFLQSFMLVFGDVRTLPFIDGAIGFVLYAGILFAIFRALELSITTSLALVLLIFIAPLVRSNLTMAALPAALFGSLFLIETEPSLGSSTSWQRSLFLGLAAAALISIKSTYVAPALLVCGFYYCAVFLSERRLRIIGHAAFFALVTSLILLPWMLDMKRKEATYLFPIFGKGYDASAYGLALPSGSHMALISNSFWVWVWVLPYAGPLFLAAAAAFIAHRKKAEPEWLAFVSFFLAVAFAVIAVSASTGGESTARYVAPFQIPSLLISVAFALRLRSRLNNRPLWLRGTLAASALGLLFNGMLFGLHGPEYIRFGQEAGLVHPTPYFGYHVSLQDEQRRLAALQAVIPPKQPILAHLWVSSSFDWKRNPIFIADWMGMASLPPGMPVDKGSDALRSYLLNHSIRYVAYDYKHTRLPDPFPGVGVQAVLSNPAAFGRHSWVTVQAKVSEDEQHSIRALAKEYKHIYDDGQIYVLDLRTLEPHT